MVGVGGVEPNIVKCSSDPERAYMYMPFFQCD